MNIIFYLKKYISSLLLMKSLTTWKMTLLIVKKLRVGTEIISSQQKLYLLIGQEVYRSIYFIYFLWSSVILFCHDALMPHVLFPIFPDMLFILWTCSNLISLPENGQRESYTLFLIRCFRALHNSTNASLALGGISCQKPQGPAFIFLRPHCQGNSQPLLDLLCSYSQSRPLSIAVFTTQFHLISTSHPQSHCAISV